MMRTTEKMIEKENTETDVRSKWL